MILIDYSQVAISNIAVQLAMSKDKNILSIPMVRHMILNSIRGYVHRFRNDYPGEVVICVDGPDPWRRDIFEQYKAKRREGRDNDDKDWESVFGLIHTIKEELRDNFPYKVVQLDKVEADDIIATIVKRTHKKWFNEKYLIISGDKDFQQLQKYPNVYQYSPIQKKFIETDSPQEYIYEHILRGDTSDGIPNFLSPDDTFVNKIKQKPVAKKKLAGWIDSLMRGNDPQDFCNEYHYRNYQRNQRLIDFDYIPDDIETDIYKEYEKVTVPSRSKILPYMIKNDLKELIGKIEEF
jgi:5'-3' exonuclease|tara:strand:+ start:1156 stop:2034 length:879 start_codon:yes stop_codon:yes gene_type:complete